MRQTTNDYVFEAILALARTAVFGPSANTASLTSSWMCDRMGLRVAEWDYTQAFWATKRKTGALSNGSRPAREITKAKQGRVRECNIMRMGQEDKERALTPGFDHADSGCRPGRLVMTSRRHGTLPTVCQNGFVCILA